MKPNLTRNHNEIPTMWAATKVLRTVDFTGQSWSYMQAANMTLDYIGIEWADSGMSMNGKLYQIS
jgi:apolipoprotein N-acyltransferase